MVKNKNNKFFLLIFVFLFSFFIFNKQSFSLNTQTEGFDIGYGTSKDIDVHGYGKNVRRSGTPAQYSPLFIPTSALLEWDNFCANHPTDTNCCPALSTALGTGSSGYLNFNDCNFGCNSGYFHNVSVCAACTYSAWSNYDCLNTSVWQQSKTRTNGNDSECPVLYQTTATSCEYCNANGTENPSAVCSSHGSRNWTCAMGNHTKTWGGCSCYISTNSTTTITPGYFTTTTSCDTACTYNAWSNYSCNSSSKWVKSATRSNGNDTNCPVLTYTSTDACAYCTANGSDACTITNGTGTNPYTCTANNKVYSGCVVASCNATYYKANTTTCSLCALGQWSPASNVLTTCNSCTNMGTGGSAYTSRASSNACTYSCAQNYYGSTGTACTACAAETWTSAGNNNAACSACTYNGFVNTTCSASNTWNATRTISAGNAAACTLTSTTNNGACSYCTAGGSDTAGCNNHGSRTYTCVSNNKNFGSCTCTTSTNSGATITLGYFDTATYCASTCAYNAWGNYDCTTGNVWQKLASRSNGNATNCPDLLYTSAEACTYCSEANGTYVANATSQACAITNGAGIQYKGYTCNSHNRTWDASWGTCTPTSCNAGFGVSGNTCVACAAGTYKAGTGATTCTACAAGNVTNTLTGTGATTCTACAAGTYDGDSNSTTACSNCGAGYYCTGGTARAACAAGTYTASATASSCTICGAGYVTNTLTGAGATTCTICGAGNADTDSSSTTACVACAAGTYQGSTGQTSCTACGAGNVTNTLAGTGATTCTACPGATYDGDSNSTTACSSCAVGTYSTGGATSCFACTNATAGAYAYTSNASSNACTFNCTTNYYGSTGTACTACAADTWTSAGNNAASCTACTYGPWSNSGDCCSNGTWTAVRSRSNGNDSACTATSSCSVYGACSCNDGNTETTDNYYGYCSQSVGAGCKYNCGQWSCGYIYACQANHTCCDFVCNCCECGCNSSSCCSGPEC